MTEENYPSFLGQGWNFPPRFDGESKELALVQAQADIDQSLHILLHTEPGERVMNPEYGCALRQFLFENMVSSQLTRLQDVVNKAILRFEPRVVAGPVQVNTSHLTDGVLLLEVAYTIRTLNSRHNVVFPFYLQEATLLPPTTAPL
ncbi:GPW/gp25 family protein [Hymenobacter bucti]|uniref:GPW/gp25 family protein n=1 Tax=Hymenobacter bucti TaxID=1844114 RepID=A0ABW4QUH3_9BACT